MKTTFFKSKRLLLLSLVLVVTLLAMGFTMSAFASDGTDNAWTFTTDSVADPLYVKQYFNELPGAYEAEVNLPSGSYSNASPIIANYPNNSGFDCFGFQINANGKPEIYYYASVYDTTTNKVTALKSSVQLNYDVRGKGWVRLTVSDKVNEDGTHELTLYVNGVEKDTKTPATLYTVDALYSQGSTRELSIGTDGVNHFKGQLRNVAVYKAPVTASEAAKTAKEHKESENTNLLAYYDANMSGNSADFFKDQTNNGYDASKAFFERKKELRDYAYSFAFIGDTQYLVYNDVYSGSDASTAYSEPLYKYTAPIYEWIVQNKDEKKIRRVIGLGDITDKNRTLEWEYARSLYDRLSDAEIPYAVISGNHDVVQRLDDIFGDRTAFTNEIDGYHVKDFVGNYYQNFEVGDHEYMILAMQYGADDNILAWANSVVAANPDRRVIVITHDLLGYEGQWSEPDTREETTTDTTDSEDSSRNNGIDIWNDFISLHENIVIAACGHICPEHIKHRTDVGKNGNTVHTFLIDPQGLDKATQYKTGMVAMFYFSEDGSDVQVEYVSAYKTLEAQDADPNADDVLFHERNQFSFEIDFDCGEVMKTEYGDLPVSYLAEGNVFAVFSNGKCIGTYNKWNAATQKLADYFKANKNADAQIVLLKDYDNSGDGLVINAFNYANGNLVIDLNDFTFTVNATFLNFNNYYDISNVDAANIRVKNGTLVSGSRAIIANQINNVGSNGQTYASEKVWNLTLDNVTLRTNSSYTDSNVSAFYQTMTNSATADAAQLGTKTNITFNDCIFDLKTKTPPANLKLFSMKDGINKIDVSVTINGGEILADIDTLNNVTFYTLNNGNNTDSILFGENSDGEYIKLKTGTTAKDYSHYANSFPAADGNRYFVEISDNGTSSVYELQSLTVKGDDISGAISLGSNVKYLSAVDYPFVVLDQTGKVYGVFDYLYGNQAGAMGSAIYSVLNTKQSNGKYKWNEGNTAYILMRSDYTMKKYKNSSGEEKEESFSNLAHARGKVVIDMRGHSIIADSTRTTEIFFSDVKGWSGTDDFNINDPETYAFDSSYEIKNGTFKTHSKASYVIAFKSSNYTVFKDKDGNAYTDEDGKDIIADISGKLMSWKFENVTFGVVNSSATTPYLFHVKAAANTSYSNVAPIDLTLNDCTFDYRVAANVSNFRLIGPYFHVDAAKLQADIQVNGGRLLANTLDKISLAVFEHKNDCTLSFGTGSDGKYFSVIVPTGVSISKFNTKVDGTYDGTKTIDGAELIFVNNSFNADGTVTYRLRPVALSEVSYSPKMSITLGSEFVINVYVPMDCTQRFTFGTEKYDSANNFGGKPVTLDDGKTYYLVTVSLGSAKAASEIKLVAEIDANGAMATGTFTFSIPRYAEKLIAKGSNAEKQLAMDVLAYIREAYNYSEFASLNDADEIVRANAAIDAVIGNYTAAPTTSGTTAKDKGGIVTGVTLNLDAKPTIRFYVTDTSVEFFANGKKLNTGTGTDSNGAYVELDVYAYTLCETVCYGDGGSYHISTYLYGAIGHDHEALVKAFVKYTESAAAYRASVVEN